MNKKINNLITILALTLLCSCTNSKEQFTTSNGVLIENPTIISANSNGIIENYKGYVVTDNSKIIYAGKDKPVVKGTYKTINGKGKFVIPGLIDSHVHLNNIAGINFRQRKANKALVKDYFERLPKNFLYFGYTTLIDVDNYAPKAMNRLKAVKLRPEIYTCGRKLQIMDDFTITMEELPKNERYKLPFLHDKYNTNVSYPDSLNLEKHSASNIVSGISEEGNICVKTLYEDASSGLPQFWELPSKQIIKDVVAEAHKDNLKVIMHATSFEGQQFATKTGVDIIAHAMWNWTANPKEYTSTQLPETHKQLLLDIAEKQIGYQPTIRTILAEKDILDNEFKNDEILKNLYSTNYLNWIQKEG